MRIDDAQYCFSVSRAAVRETVPTGDGAGDDAPTTSLLSTPLDERV
jgi:hypothetical protein